jgi:ubiquinone/menaquinone biosynthesis C-methylase UbiE
MSVPRSSESFDAGAAGYEATIAQTLRPVARRVVELAALQPDEAVLDVGTGTGNAAAAAVGDGRRVVGIDGAPGMLEIARQNVPGATFEVMDFAKLELPDGSFDAVIASHSLNFSRDRTATLAEWLRVARPGGRLALSVPGPLAVTPNALYGEIYERHGIGSAGRYPTAAQLADEAAAAGWRDARTIEDPSLSIRLANEELFRTWRSIGSRAETTRDWTPEQHEELTREMLAATPREADGAFVVPFGAIYLTARRAN